LLFSWDQQTALPESEISTVGQGVQFMTTLYVGNLPYSVTEESLSSLFEAHGPVSRTKLVMDRETGRSKGFAFLDMQDEDAWNAISALNGTLFEDRTIRVNEARPRR